MCGLALGLQRLAFSDLLVGSYADHAAGPLLI